MKIPIIRQQTESDCAAACLAMVLAAHGRKLGIAAVRESLPPGRGGRSALDVLEAAKRQGLAARGVQLGADALGELTPGSILHWASNHFVVLESATAERIVVVDPAHGRRTLSLSQAREQMSGIAIELWPSPTFIAQAETKAALTRYLRPLLQQRRTLATAGLLSLLLVVSSLALPLATKVVVDDLVVTEPRDWALLFALGTLGLALTQAMTSFARGLALVRLREAVDRGLMDQLVRKLVSLPYSFFRERSVGDLVMRLGSTVHIREVLTTNTLSAALDGGLVAIYLAVLAWLSGSMAMAAGVLALMPIGLFMFSRRRLQEHTSQYLSAEAESRGYQTRMLMGIETLKALGAAPEAAAHFDRIHDRVLDAARRRGRFAAAVEGIAAGFRALTPLCILAVGAYAVIAGDMSLGTMFGAGQLAAAFLVPAASLVQTAAQVHVLRSHVDRLEDIHATPSEAKGERLPVDIGAIEVRNVSFRYAPNEPLCLDDISLTIAPGQHVAIVGSSGSGKSTLARILLGLLAPERGSISFDGIPLAACDIEAIRRASGIVTQEGSLFNLTIAENIALGRPEATEAEIQRAADLAQVHDDIVAMPMGYATRLFDGGCTLSGGQQQRITLARALLRQPRLLVLDEATSALDAIRERAIQRALEAMRCTVITIAHRLSTVARADVIYVLEGGRIVEAGPHDELLRRDGRYRRLLREQLTSTTDLEAAS